MTSQRRAYVVLAMSTLAFAVCFAAWVMNGVLVTFLVNKGVHDWDKAQMGWLIGAPVLTGAIMRLPLGVLTDRHGGRTVFTVLMVVAAVPMYLVSYADTYMEFLLTGLGFGLAGASFAVGIAYTSLWFKPAQQGLVFGIFGMGTSGAALTTLGAPIILNILTDNGAHLEDWRLLPRLYAAALVGTAVVFWLLTHQKRVERARELSLSQRLAPLQRLQVWRFGLYYFFFFGGFVALSQWLIPYYVNVYSKSVASAGVMAAAFSLPTGAVRAFGGWLSDRWGARTLIYWALGTSIVGLIFLFPPRMDIQSPGEGVTADRPGTVTAVSPYEIVVDDRTYVLQQPSQQHDASVRLGAPGAKEGFIFLPTSSFWQEPVVKVGDRAERGQLLARGVTHVYFQANVWIFTGLTVLVGTMMGMGAAAVFKHIANYYPGRVGVVGGIVGVLGGLGGFADPIIFGYLLTGLGVWTTCWMFLAFLGLVCLVWMHVAIRRMPREQMSGAIGQPEEIAGTRTG